MGKKQETPKSFAVILAQIEGGRFLEEATDTMAELNRKLALMIEEHPQAKGSITVKLDFTAEKKGGIVKVLGTVTAKEPRTKKAEMFWLSEGDNLVQENPRQVKLPIRDVSAPAEARDLSPDTKHA